MFLRIIPVISCFSSVGPSDEPAMNLKTLKFHLTKYFTSWTSFQQGFVLFKLKLVRVGCDKNKKNINVKF